MLEQGLEFFNIGGDPAELMAFMVKNPGLMPDMRTIRSGAIQRRRREMKSIFTGCWRSCFESGDGTGIEHHVREDPWSEEVDYRDVPFVADVVIANPPSFAHLSCAEKLGIPLNMMFTYVTDSILLILFVTVLDGDMLMTVACPGQQHRHSLILLPTSSHRTPARPSQTSPRTPSSRS